MRARLTGLCLVPLCACAVEPPRPPPSYLVWRPRAGLVDAVANEHVLADPLQDEIQDEVEGEVEEQSEPDAEPVVEGEPFVDGEPSREPSEATRKTAPGLPATGQAALLARTDAELEALARKDLAALGSLSVGQASAGALIGGVRLKSGQRWRVADAGGAWGTSETIAYLTAAIDKVHQTFPGSPPLYVGHLSARNGGALAPHKSHQSGRDVDVGYFYLQGEDKSWYRRATAKNLDRARSWALVRALVTETDVQYIFVDSSLQRLLKEHAAKIGEDAAWLDGLFQYGSKGTAPIIRHVTGHDTHLHVRFFNPVAQELARRVYPVLVEKKLVRPAASHVRYKARKGDLLFRVAARFGTSVAAIQQANGLNGTRIRAGKVYLIPKRSSRPLPRPAKLVLPPRRMPPVEVAAPP